MDAKSIGKNIREYRLSKNMSQRDLAEVLFVTNKTISRWECGGGQPDIEQLAKIASVFGVTMDELISSDTLSEDSKKKDVGLLLTANPESKISIESDEKIEQNITTEQSFASAKDGNLQGKVPVPAYKENEKKKVDKKKVLALLFGAVFTISVISGGLLIGLSKKNNVNKKYVYVYEAEDALFTESFKVENVENASNGKVAAWLHTKGTSLVFKVESAKETECDLGLVFNRPRPFVFESKMKLSVNGEQITVGNVEGIGYDGTEEGLYYSFGAPISVNAKLKAGDNIITIVVTDGVNLNIDCLQIVSKSTLSLLNTEYKFEAEDAKLSGLYSRIPDKTASGGYKIGDFCIEEDSGENVIEFNITSDYRAKVKMKIELGYNCKKLNTAFLIYFNGAVVDVEDCKNEKPWKNLPFYVELILEKGNNNIKFVNVSAKSLDYVSFDTSLSLKWTKA